ncbi:hypothetical protein [Methyloglobulus sp.]|uniref:hypothetical protein n=1 Tax=Methyloglobulus sp. TaxID=2518622 RepID=UPI0032B73E58
MLSMERISNKSRDFGLESIQSLTSLLYRQKCTLSPDDQAIIDDLHQNGVHVTSLEHLFEEASKNIMEVFANVAADLEISGRSNMPHHMQEKACSVDMVGSDIISKYPEIFFLGLSQRILNIAETYLGLPAAYHGVALRRSLVDGMETGPRLWHKDAEDFRVVRIVVYLNDVETAGGGPFEYVPRSYGLRYKQLNGIDGKLTEENMLKVVPHNVMQQCYGKAGTVIIADTANTFHHEKLQVTQQRSVAMFGFSTRLPKSLSLAKSHFPAEAIEDQLKPLLSPSQLPYVYGWRK